MKTQSRREFLATTAVGSVSVSSLFLLSACTKLKTKAERPPNIVLIVTDDQGFGDLGCHGNDKIKTPNLDRLCSEGVELTQFHVSPVCSPTRASLMTGRYNYRTGVVDTYLGRSMMYPDEVTLAELLKASGYQTGIFGKWHLGDTYPLRPNEQGFHESLVHEGGGLAQPSGPEGNSYFNPILQHNGKSEKYEGYCSDIFTTTAIQFIENNKAQSFFAYLAFNAPHEPLQIEQKYVEPYKAMGLDDTTAGVYGMVTNLDENVGRLLEKLTTLNLNENTIVVFMTDNGPQHNRYNCGMRDRKGSVYEGGIRVPCFIRWQGTLKGGLKVDRLSAHIDILPTLLEICGVSKPSGLSLDGQSLFPLLSGRRIDWQDRTLFFQWHRGDEPVLYKNCAARSQQYKLVNGKELYDLGVDPGEQNDIAAQNPGVVEKMCKDYESWFRDVSSTRGYKPPRIQLGTQFQNPVVLTRQDWRGANNWSDADVGYWEVFVTQTGSYTITLRFTRQSKV